MEEVISSKIKYQKEVIPQMMEKYGLKNVYQVPIIEKIVVNLGIGKILSQAKDKEKMLKEIEKDISLITGQKPSLRKSRKAISAFKLRKGMPVGLKVTLRGQRMYDFLDRLINIYLPRVRDFRGLSLNLFDEQGNLNIGFKDLSPFPEIGLKKLIFGLEVSIVIRRAKNKEQAIEFLRLLGLPLKKK